MALDLLLLAFGIVLLLAGGEALVRGATALARALGVSPLIIGLTVVAFGTSAPELSVNLFAAWNDRTEISFGNIVGSNLANIGLIVGAVSMLRPIRATGVVISREIPMMLLATAATLIMGFDGAFGSGVDRYHRGDGALLLLLFLVFLFYTVGDLVKLGRPPGERSTEPLWRHVGVTGIGLAGLLLGADLAVDAAVEVAEQLGVSDVIIGITVLAIGTSLPELVASILAALRGSAELAIGNIVGSNIFNLLLVFGLTSLMRPVPVPKGGHLDLLLLALLSLTLFFVSMTRRSRMIRAQSVVLFVGYLGYIAWRATTHADF